MCLRLRVSILATKPVVVLDPKESLIQELKKEIAKLRRHNAHLQRNLQDNVATRPSTSMALQGEDEAEAAQGGAQAGVHPRASRQHRSFPPEENALPAGPAPARRGRPRDEQGGQTEQRPHLNQLGVPGFALQSEGGAADAGGGVGERMYAHKLASKTRYVLSEHRRAQEMRRGHGDCEQHAQVVDGRYGQGSGDVEGGRADGGLETERDARLMQELQRLMHEYVEHQGRAAVPGAAQAEARGVGRRAGPSSTGAGRCDDGSGSEGGVVDVDVSEHGEWDEEWEDGEEDQDLLNLVRYAYIYTSLYLVRSTPYCAALPCTPPLLHPPIPCPRFRRLAFRARAYVSQEMNGFRV